MDKKQLLRPNLARIMELNIHQIDELVKLHPSAAGNLKQDGSPVTSLDLALSTLLENLTHQHFPQCHAYSEESLSEWKFPLMAIDPLDGTKEYIKQRPEWAVSTGYFPSEVFEGEGWVYNPALKEKFDSQQVPTHFSKKETYIGEVSRTEWEKGLYHQIEGHKFKISPMGSIAYKLGRLSAGKIDFVVSLVPKNIWDIAGGTLLCQNSKIKFYSQGVEVIKVKKSYDPPLIWCHEEIFLELSGLF